MLCSIALIHFLLVLQSQMARLSSKRRRQSKQSPLKSRRLDHPNTLCVSKRTQTELHPRHSQRSLRNISLLSSGAESQITLRLTHRRQQQYQGSGHAEGDWTAPTSGAERSGDMNQEDDGICKAKDREYWLRNLRPRSSRDLTPAKGTFC